MLVIVHFAPLELYPPIQNLIELIDQRGEPYERSILSTKSTNKKLSFINSSNPKTKLFRIGKSNDRLKPLTRYWNYLLFYASSLLIIIWKRPSLIFYYETVSCWPAYFYRRFINRKCKLYIHYHEYTSPEEYRNGTLLVRIFNRFEKHLYPLANWISHTNKYRVNLFLSDIMPITPTNVQIIPNYPPKKWFSSKKEIIKNPLRIVYVGSVSIDTMYTKQFVSWVLAQKGSVLFDLYSLYIDLPAVEYFFKLDSNFIELKQGVDYKDLPNVLRNYDVGVILYKGHIANYVYNAPNKLFEYLAVGLDVWFPEELKGAQDYVRTDRNPKILSVDFKNMEIFDLHLAIRTNMENATDDFFCENAFDPLLNKIKNNVDSVLG